tara:strand:- start:356 stop:538 length:183 start_codon:yes stop_codon:yes gene_type:complete
MDPIELRKNGFDLIEYKGPLDRNTRQKLPLVTFESKIYLAIRSEDITLIKKYRNLGVFSK